jgi:hypothetical protein
MKSLPIFIGGIFLSGILFLAGCQTTETCMRDEGTTGGKKLCCSQVVTYSQSFSPKGPSHETTLITTKRICRDCSEVRLSTAGNEAYAVCKK